MTTATTVTSTQQLPQSVELLVSGLGLVLAGFGPIALAHVITFLL